MIRARLQPGLRPALLATLFVALPSRAELPVPDLSGRVVDEADLFDDQEETKLGDRLKLLESRGRAQMAVLTVESLGGEPIEDFSLRVVDQWRLGDAAKDDGLLLLVARGERRMRLEVGYGLEDVIPDAVARRLLDRVITPAYAAGDYAGGTLAAIEALAAAIEGHPPAELRGERIASPLTCLVFLLVAIWFVLWIWLYRRQKRGFEADVGDDASAGGRGEPGRGWSSKVNRGRSWRQSRGWGPGVRRPSTVRAGSIFTGGGGSFGGGGASGSW